MAVSTGTANELLMTEPSSSNVRERAVDLGLCLSRLAADLGCGSVEENSATVIKTIDAQSWEDINSVADGLVNVLSMYKAMCNEMRARTASIRERLGVVEYTNVPEAGPRQANNNEQKNIRQQGDGKGI